MTEKSSLYNDYFTKLFQIWEEAISQTTKNALKNEFFEDSQKRTSDKTSEFNSYMKDIMSKNMSENSLGLTDDIETLNKSIDKVHLQLDVIKKKLDKLTNPKTDNNKLKNK